MLGSSSSGMVEEEEEEEGSIRCSREASYSPISFDQP